MLSFSAPVMAQVDKAALGQVKNIAEVKVNGKAYPTLWKPPFRLDVTEAEEEKFIADVDQVIGEELINQVTEEQKGQTSTNQATEEAKQ